MFKTRLSSRFSVCRMKMFSVENETIFLSLNYLVILNFYHKTDVTSCEKLMSRNLM